MKRLGTLKGLLAHHVGAPEDMLTRFYVMGGECNYLCRVVIASGKVHLAPVDGALWKDARYVKQTSGESRHPPSG